MKTVFSLDKNIYWGILCVIIYMLPYIIYGEDSYITVHDHLDSTIAHYQNIKSNGLLFEHHGIVPILCGIDRVYFSSYPYLELKLFLYSIMPMYWAIVCSCFLWKLTAFVGMYLLLKNYIVPETQRWIAFFSSIMFALIPFYVDYSLSSAGMPLLFYAFLNLMTNKKKLWKDFLIIIYVGLNSSLALSGFFALIVLFLMAAYYYKQEKKIPRKMLWGISFLSIIYIFTNYETLQSLFIGGDFISHRTEFVNSTNAVRDFGVWLQMLVVSQYHAGSLFSLPILLAFGILYLRYNKENEFRKLFLISLIIIVGSLIGVMGKTIGLRVFNSIQFDRFYFLFPSLCIILFAKECSIIENYKHCVRKWIVFIGLLIVVPFIKEYRCFGERLVGLKTEIPTYSQFYDVELFDTIMSQLNINPNYSTKVVCIGLFPAVAEYNGFYTLDSYFYNYPLDYKHLFRGIIAKEIEKSSELKKYYDCWGSRCYLFSSELGLSFMFSKNEEIHIKDFFIDTNSLKLLDCKYIISAVPIEESCKFHLNYIGEFTSPKSFWKLYLYEI